ncbi:hypothetical protein FHX08_000810 [Rhizobium sp. BK529]|uniref:hypothetical protein n=1 Tax=unclassified Rhizobium TaxID=2613769 RepID=UPI00104F38C4|nr:MULTISPECIES: hypothetical protein [unclassified Rhizobium]MBB3590466.1 hypothetical protein [Rhizobium sp. BK529]TCS05156.1 hypothetical protein EV281_103838 [Rhizobium sp. BK418]
MSNLHNDSAPEFSGGEGRSTLTAFFDSRDDAENAIDRLRNLGITSVRMMPGYEADSDKAGVAGDDRGGFWAKLEDWLFPDEDRSVYAEGLRRGGFLISVEVDDATYGIAHDILDDEGSIDMDERADLWRAEGWDARKSNEALAASRYRTRGYDLDEEPLLDPELRDDILPTGHHRTVDEANEDAERELRRAQDVDAMKQDQTIPRGR